MNSVGENTTTASRSDTVGAPLAESLGTRSSGGGFAFGEKRGPYIPSGWSKRRFVGASLAKSSVLVIGWGNDLLGDDAVGRLVAQDIATRHWPGVEAVDVHQLTPELSVQLSRTECVIFVDACMDSEQETVRLRKLSRDVHADPLASGHVATPEGLLRMADALYDARPEAWLIAVPARAFELGQPLSEIARAGFDAAVRAIRQRVLTGTKTNLEHNDQKGNLYDADR